MHGRVATSRAWSRTLWHLDSNLAVKRERVQRHFTKRITVLRNLKYDKRLACLELDTLECRRLKADLILCYKIMYNLTLWPIDRYLTCLFTPAILVLPNV